MIPKCINFAILMLAFYAFYGISVKEEMLGMDLLQCQHRVTVHSSSVSSLFFPILSEMFAKAGC